jgi:4a-hydroxytetrahydrobiopterin dehydratase
MAPTPVTATEFATHAELHDWRYILGRIEATFRADSFEGAARLSLAIAAAADAADHHPDLDVRYPDLVRVALTTHAVGRVTELDLALATTISGLAHDAGARTEPVTAQGYEVAIDAMDIDAVRPFWEAVLGYIPETPRSPGGQIIAIVDPARIGPAFWFQQMDEPRPQRNRIHIDVTVAHDIAEARVAEAVTAGGRLISRAAAPAFWVLADPQGNRACLTTWQGRESVGA